MALTSELLRYQLGHAAWANARILSAANQLTPEEFDHDFASSEKTIRLTLVHIYRAERLWHSRLVPPLHEYRVAGDDTMVNLNADWPVISERWQDFASRINEESSGAHCTYRDLRGNPWTQPLWQIIHHVANHSTHHRGQAIGFIRALGHTPPNVDSITFGRES
jgi:uncharacterized damage-inducible protein DinB